MGGLHCHNVGVQNKRKFVHIVYKNARIIRDNILNTQIITLPMTVTGFSRGHRSCFLNEAIVLSVCL